MEKSVFLKKQLNNVLEAWPVHLRAEATMVLIDRIGWKLMGEKMSLCVLHTVMSGLEQRGGHWFSLSRILK